MARMALDLDRYLARVGLPDRPPADLAGLAAVHAAQLRAVPFENLDILLGRGVDVAPEAIFAKLVGASRGGYCFEANSLLQLALAALGFDARLLLGRVIFGGGEAIPARTHALVLVELPGERVIVDAGFGAHSPRAPLPLRHGAELERVDLRWRLRRDDEHGWRLENRVGADWCGLYVFDEARVYGADVALGNWWTSTSPACHFTSTISAARHTDAGRVTLIGRRLTYRDARGKRERDLETVDELAAAIRDDLAIPLDAGAAEIERIWRAVAPATDGS